MNNKLLFIAPIFNPLHTQIIKTLEAIGYNVTFVPDKAQPFSPYPKKAPFKLLKKIIYRFNNKNLQYHKKYNSIYEEFWDIVLCINGCSIEPKIISLLKKQNPKIRSYLYLWDSTRLYEFQRNFTLFDYIYTFDPLDAEKFKVNYLPLFWVPMEEKNQKLVYDISFIGKFYGDRYLFLKKIQDICSKFNLKYYIRIVLTRRITLRDRVYSKLLLSDSININTEDPIVTTEYLTVDQVSNIIKQSRCIVDTEMKNQYGLTNRTIISLAQSKKVITTNSHISVDPIFNKNPNIYIIDRDNPIIDEIFIKSPYIHTKENDIVLSQLRIDNWLKIILNGKQLDV